MSLYSDVPVAAPVDFALAAVEHCNAALAQIAAISEEVEDGDTLHSLARQADMLEGLIDELSCRFGIVEPRREAASHLHIIAAE
ncbi:MAG TPA: hypothetical protein VEB64_09630 [Azospirillaceae bacterium]|nr:hypothetical protein [Azospirillaceae bacterium]